MMAHPRWLLPVVIVAVVLASAVGSVTAHETKTVDGYEVTFGGGDEPVITGERMWLQIEIVDAESGEPVEGQGDSLQMAVQRPFGNDTFDLDVDGVYGRPGWYEGAVVFTEPGTYTIYVSGTIDGTDVETNFSKQVHDASNLEYPERTETGGGWWGLDGAAGFGLGVATAAFGMAAAFLVGRRR